MISPLGDLWRYRNCSGTTPGFVSPFPRAGVGTAPRSEVNCIGMQWTSMHWIPIHSMTPSIPMDRYPFQWYRYLSIGMDGVAAAEGEVDGRVRPFLWWIRGKTAAGIENPAPPGARKRPFWARFAAFFSGLASAAGRALPTSPPREGLAHARDPSFRPWKLHWCSIHRYPCQWCRYFPMEYIHSRWIGLVSIAIQFSTYQWTAIDCSARKETGRGKR